MPKYDFNKVEKATFFLLWKERRASFIYISLLGFFSMVLIFTTW